MQRNIVKSGLGRKVIIESFKSYSEMIETNDSRTSNFGYDRRVEGRKDFDFNSYDQALSWLYNYDKHIQLFKTNLKDVDTNKTIEYKKTKNVIGVAGFQPVIPNALMGLPNSMISTQVVSKKSKVLNVLVDSTYAYSTTSREVAEKFSQILAHLTGLEKQGFRVRISLMYLFGKSGNNNKVHVCKILLKSENQPIDLKRMMFPLTNLGAFRLFGWDWYERLPEGEQISGYGQAIYHWNQKWRDDINTVLGEPNSKAYVLHIHSDPKVVFKDVK